MINNKTSLFLALLLQAAPAIACSSSILDERYEELDRLSRRYIQVRSELGREIDYQSAESEYARSCRALKAMVEIQDERIRVMNEMKRYCSEKVDLDDQVQRVSSDVSVWRNGVNECSSLGF